VEPHPSFVACRGQLTDRINGARVRRADVGADEERQPISGEIRIDGRGDVLRTKPEIVVGRENAN
jgi:hypothetical protein